MTVWLLFLFAISMAFDLPCQSKSGDCPIPCPIGALGNNGGYFISWVGWDRNLRQIMKYIQQEMRIYNQSAVVNYQNRWKAHISFHYFCCHSLLEEFIIKHSLQSYLNRKGFGQKLFIRSRLGCNYRINEFNNKEIMLHLIFEESSRNIGNSIALTVEEIIKTQTNVSIWNPWLLNCPELHITIGTVDPNYFPIELFLEKIQIEPLAVTIKNYILSGSQWSVGQIFI